MGLIMTTIYEIECDKCAGKVIDYVEQPKIHCEKIKASDYFKLKSGPQYNHAVYTYTHHILICTECGHIMRYSV